MTKTATVTLSRALFLSPPAFLKYRNGILFAAVRASKRLFVIIQIYAVIQGHLYHFKLFGCSSSGAGQTIPQRPKLLSVSFCSFLYSSPLPERSETVMIVTASKGTCCNSAKTKWDLVGRVWLYLERPYFLNSLSQVQHKPDECLLGFGSNTRSFIN